MSVASRRKATGLPAETTTFVGRRSELAEARRLLADTRMLTLTGVGGVGKTRLAVKIAADLERAFSDGVWLVELADVTDKRLIAANVADTVGILQVSEPVTALCEFLADRQLLLVLDNCEHVLDTTAALAEQLLRAAPGLRILATSRHPLDIPGETTLEVPPLSLPRPEALGSPDSMLGWDAITLFVDRATAIQRGFALNDGNAAVVGQVCHRLDGIPLAIELAAVWLRSLSLEQMLNRLDDQLQMLSRGGRRAVPPRQRTLRAALDWSYELCSPDEKLLWARLSVFSGSLDVEAAEEVCAGDGLHRREILDLVHGLLTKSIITRTTDRGGPARYRLLETIRQYGRQRLVASGEETLLLQRHRDWCLRLAEEAEGEFFLSDQTAWMKRLTREHVNLRAAVEFSLSEPDGAQSAMAIGAATWLHWLVTGSLTEVRQWLAQALADAPEPSPIRAKALWTQGACAIAQGDLAEGGRLLDASRRLAQDLGDETALAWTIAFSGWAAQFQGDLPRAVELLTDALQRHQALGNTSAVANITTLLGEARMWLGGHADVTLAEALLTFTTERGLTWSSSYAMYHLAIAVFQQGDLPRSAALLRESSRIQRDCHDRIGTALSLETLAWVTGAEGRHTQAAELLGASGVLWRSFGTLPASFAQFDEPRAYCTGEAQADLGEKAFQQAFRRGETELDDVIARALGSQQDDNRGTSAATTALTRRECEVASLVAQGLSNRQISTQLVIAQRTAESHVENILTKLAFRSRTQIATWAADNLKADLPDYDS
jgi:predicted ATPase/DNA-binding CsgD family transcriptional regulator